MKQTIAGIFAIIAFANPGVANAQTFTFEGTSSEPTRVGGIGPNHADYECRHRQWREIQKRFYLHFNGATSKR